MTDPIPMQTRPIADPAGPPSQRRRALQTVTDAYRGHPHALLHDIADRLGASLAYIDRATIEAHLRRPLTDAEWTAARTQYRAMDFDAHVGDAGTLRTDWIQTILDRAEIPSSGNRATIWPGSGIEYGSGAAAPDKVATVGAPPDDAALLGASLAWRAVLRLAAANLDSLGEQASDRAHRLALHDAVDHLNRACALLTRLQTVLNPTCPALSREHCADDLHAHARWYGR